MKKGYKSPRIYSVTIPLKMKEKASMHIKMKYTLMLIINLLHRSTKAVRFHSHPCTARHFTSFYFHNPVIHEKYCPQ